MSKRKLDADWLENGDDVSDYVSPDEIDNEIHRIDLQMDEIGEKAFELEYVGLGFR